MPLLPAGSTGCAIGYIFGFQNQINGGMARYCLLPGRRARVHKVPESLIGGEAAYIEPAACAWHAVDRGEIKPGDTVVIAGVGQHRPLHAADREDGEPGGC